jgi:hypothetical protein
MQEISLPAERLLAFQEGLWSTELLVFLVRWWLPYPLCCDVTDTPDYVTIYKAITNLNVMTCVRFVPWNGKDKDFLLIWPVKQPKG